MSGQPIVPSTPPAALRGGGKGLACHPAAVQRLRSRDAAARVELREDYSAVLAKLLLDGALAVVIAALPYAFEHVDTEVLGTDALVVAVPVLHPAAATAAARHNTPRCAYVPVAEHKMEREIVAVWRRDAVRLPRARAFVDGVRDVVSGV